MTKMLLDPQMCACVCESIRRSESTESDVMPDEVDCRDGMRGPEEYGE